MSSTIRDDYNQLITTLRVLEKVLGPAVAVRYLAPPGGAGEVALNGIPNPTLDTVLDPRRLALSEAISTTSAVFRETAAKLASTTDDLSAALAGWEGDLGGTEK